MPEVNGPAHRVALVTDSTSYLPYGAAESAGVVVVPVQVVVAGQVFDDGGEESVRRVAEALQAWQPVTTSRPSPERFAAAFSAAAAEGATAVVCATLSSDMSATYESALLAAREAPLPVLVVDSRTIGMALGFAVLEGARVAATGAPPEDVAAAVEKRAAASSMLFYVDTLEYLRRGGRIGAARAAVGQALQVKPILGLVDGHVVQLERVRTAGKAITRLAELAVERAGSGPVDIAVQHLDSAARADDLAGRLAALLPAATVVRSPVGAVVGAHVGPGMVAVVVSPR